MLLFSCVLYLSPLLGVMSQVQLTQPPSEIRKPGDSVKISCKTSGYTFTSYNMHWVQQVPGKGLTWVGYIYPGNGGTEYSSSFKGRFTISTDNAITTAFLQIDSLTMGDTATYYCARSGGGYFDIWGPGTMVTVTSAEQSSPSLFPLISCGMSQDSTVTIGCLAKDFLPDSISFSWTDKSNDSFTSGLKKYNSVLQTSGTYAASSQITVTSTSWNKADPFYCEAKTATNSKSLKLVKGSVIGRDPRKPTVTMYPPLKQDLEKNGEGTIICVAAEFYPQPIKVSWLKNHKVTTLHTETDEVSQDDNGNFTIRSFITVPKKDWNEDVVVSCRVEHSDSGFDEMRNLSKSQVYDTVVQPDSLQVIAIPPSFETMFLTKTAPLTCLVINMASVDGLDISWYEKGSDARLKTDIESPVFHENGTYSTKAITSVCVDDWLKKEFTCLVTHPELATPSKVSLAKENGQGLRTPTVLVFPPHQDEINMGESLTMLCLVKGFYPKDTFVKWLIGGKMVEANVVNTDPIVEINRYGETTYFMYSKLTLLNGADWNAGKSFACLAGHESLPLQTTQRSIDKNFGKPTSVNVSLIMSDSC